MRRRPAIGQTVVFTRRDPDDVRPALVVKAHDDGRVDLVSFFIGEACCASAHERVPEDAGPEPADYTWSWPVGLRSSGDPSTPPGSADAHP